MVKILIRIKNFFTLLHKFATTPPVHYCNCICHYKAFILAQPETISNCEHCNGNNAVSRFRHSEGKTYDN